MTIDDLLNKKLIKILIPVLSIVAIGLSIAVFFRQKLTWSTDTFISIMLTCFSIIVTFALGANLFVNYEKKQANDEIDKLKNKIDLELVKNKDEMLGHSNFLYGIIKKSTKILESAIVHYKKAHKDDMIEKCQHEINLINEQKKKL
jgi:purine-cytosine permease-like protein